MRKRTPDINAILRADRRPSSRGAPMGDSNRYAGSIYLHLQRVRFVDGDYGPDGTYWGHTPGEHLWCAFNGQAAEYAPAMGTRIYVRAATRAKAKAEVKKNYVNVRWFR